MPRSSATRAGSQARLSARWRIGSIYKKGLTTANMVEQMRRKDKEAVKGGVKAWLGHSRTGKATDSAQNVFVAEGPPRGSDPELMRYAIGRRKIEDDTNKEYERRYESQGKKMSTTSASYGCGSTC